MRLAALFTFLMIVACSTVVAAQEQQLPQCPEKTRFDPHSNQVLLTDCHGTILIRTPIKADREAAAVPPVSTDKEPIAENPLVEKAHQDYAIWLDDYTKRVYEHQDVYTAIIFAMVNLLVIAGLFFAGLQFKASLVLPRRPGSKRSAKLPDSEMHTQPIKKASSVRTTSWATQKLKIGPHGVAISSSFIGLIILGFSLCFYLLYLKYVYPIETVGSSPSVSEGAKANDNAAPRP